MKIHTEQFKTNIKRIGRQLDNKITYELDGEIIELDGENLNSVNRHFKSDILKSVMKQLDIDSNVEIPVNTIINYQFGVKVNGEYEYLNYGNFVVYKVEKQEDTRSYNITCYDKMLYSMKDYENMNITYPITIRDYISTICNNIGLTFKNENDEFANYDKEIPNELYINSEGNSLGYKYRDVLDELAQVTASTICINDDTDELEIRYINDTEDIVDEEFFKDINVKFGKKYGPINSIVLSRASESDNIFLSDAESISTNGLCEVKIKDNQIMNFNDRSDYLPDILEKLDGLEYFINDFTSTGIGYYEICDKYQALIGNNTYNCVFFNDEFIATQGLEENIYTDMPEDSETDYSKADKTDRRINQTYIIAKKTEGEIEALTSQTTSITDRLGNTYTIDETNQLIQNASTGLTNTFTNIGGENIFKNTGLFFENTGENSQTSPFDYWNGYLKRQESYDPSATGTAMLIQSGTIYQELEIPNGTYTVNLKFEQLNPTAHCSVRYNGREIALEELENGFIPTTGQITTRSIKFEIICDTDDSFLIYELMGNLGTEPSTYSQNMNELRTDTVNISKGISVSSNSTNTTAKIDADGFRVINNNSGNNVLKATSTGIETPDVKANSGTIANLYFQQVGDQTWITGLGE